MRDVFSRLCRAPAHIYERVSIFLEVDKAVREGVLRVEAQREQSTSTAANNVTYVKFGGSPPPKPPETPPPRTANWWVIAGVSALAIGALMALLMNDGAVGSTYQTAPSQTRTEELPDDSVMDLAGGSLAKARFSKQKRVVHLQRGEVTFTVRSDKDWPFVVVTPLANVTAVGTKFTVTVGDTVKVVVHEGIVDFARDEPGTPVIRLKKGNFAIAHPDGMRAVLAAAE